MTVSASTARLRLTLAWYVALLVVVALGDRPCADGLGGKLAAIAGLLLMVAAALGRIWASLFIAGHKDSQLVTTGPYAACRNPLYAWSLVGGLGVGLASGSVVLTAATLVLLAVLYWRAIRAEEALLEARHGEAFRRYCSEVPCLMPRLRRQQPPEWMQVNARVYVKAFVDAASFLLLFALLLLTDALRATGILPTLFTLW